jgi:hypothetical protein
MVKRALVKQIKVMKKFFWVKPVVIVAIVVLLFIAFWLINYWKSGGPDVAFWVGNIMLNWLSVCIGVIMMVQTRGRKQVPLFLLGAIVTLMGILLFLNTIRFLSMDCPAPGCGIIISY